MTYIIKSHRLLLSDDFLYGFKVNIKELIDRLVSFLFGTTAADAIGKSQDKINKVTQREGALIRDLVEAELVGVQAAAQASAARLEALIKTGALWEKAADDANTLSTALKLATIEN